MSSPRPSERPFVSSQRTSERPFVSSQRPPVSQRTPLSQRPRQQPVTPAPAPPLFNEEPPRQQERPFNDIQRPQNFVQSTTESLLQSLLNQIQDEKFQQGPKVPLRPSPQQNAADVRRRPNIVSKPVQLPQRPQPNPPRVTPAPPPPPAIYFTTSTTPFSIISSSVSTTTRPLRLSTGRTGKKQVLHTVTFMNKLLT